jgi:hypothetical protein
LTSKTRAERFIVEWNNDGPPSRAVEGGEIVRDVNEVRGDDAADDGDGSDGAVKGCGSRSDHDGKRLGPSDSGGFLGWWRVP